MRKLLSILFCVFCSLSLTAQFYNGLQQDFGKNRVQYDEKFWFYFRHDKFDIYFDKNGRNLAEFVARNVDSSYVEIKKFMEFDYSRRIVFVVYNTLGDFQQSNIGFSTSDDESNVGGTTQIIDNKVALYFSGDHNDFLRQIRKGVAEVMLSEFLFGIGSYRRILSNSALATYPEWFFDGMTEYLSKSWNDELEQLVCQQVELGNYRKVAQLYGEDAPVVGHALWHYIAEQYDDKIIANVLYLSKLTDDIDASFQYVMGKSLQMLLTEMNEFYAKKQRTGFDEYEQYLSLPKRLTKHKITDFALSPDASNLGVVTNKNGKTRVMTYNFESGKAKKVFGIGSPVIQITDYSYPVVQWNPAGTALVFFYEKKGSLWMRIYNCQAKEFVTRPFHHFEKVLDFSYSSDGSNIVFSGVKGGQTDVFTYNLQTFENVQITDDDADDRYPSYAQNDTKILFVSNRGTNELNNRHVAIQDNYDLFLLASDSLQRLTSTEYDEKRPSEFGNGTYLYVNNAPEGNRVKAISLDSAVSYVDTAFHYSYSLSDFEVPNTTAEVQNYATSEHSMIQLIFHKGCSHFKRMPLESHDLRAVKRQENQSTIQDSFFDTTLFERETANLYKTNFYINSLVNQIDFSFVNTGYQSFTGGEYDYTQNMNVLLKLGIIDLFEDYRMTGAYRFTGTLGTNEYLLSLENLRQRVDRQYIFHRQSGLTFGTNSSRYIDRVQDNNVICRFKYPFNQLQSVSVNPNLRYVRNVTLSTDMNSLNEPTTDEFWIGVSCNYVFDNVRKRDLNIFYGTRAKVFAEGFTQLNAHNSSLCVFGLDVRHYQKLHRNMILAGRIAYSTSFGSSPLLYYLGAVDNWLNWFAKYDTYNSAIQYDHTVDWAYQAIGTNMRGFSQNIRNGNSFAIANLELRWPIIQYFFQKPIKSDILKNFQIVGFTDIGGAWSGLIPGRDENAYNYTIIDKQPIYVEIDEMRQPFVYGYGFGFRTRLFGYFARFDVAWGNDEGAIQQMNHFSIGMDF